MATRLLPNGKTVDYNDISVNDPANPFLAGGSASVPPTAQPTTPQRIAPTTFLPAPASADPSALLPGKTVSTGVPATPDFPHPPITVMPPVPDGRYAYDASTTAAPSQPFINRAEDPTFETGLNALYQKYDGRDATPDEMLAHAGNPGGLAAVEAMLKAQGPAAPPTGPAGPKAPPPTDQMSGPIDAGLLDLINHHGATPDQTAMMKTLTDIISRGGDVDPAIAERSLNMARDAEATAMTGQSNDLRAQLAAHGRASTPGVTQGGEVDALTRLTEALAPIYSGQVAGIENTAASSKQASLHDALSLATGLSSNEAGNLLGTLGSGTQRQTALSNIALEQLQNDQQWNEFLASYGLQKDQVQAMIQQGNIASLVPYLQMFLKQAEQGAQGYIGTNG